MPTLLKSAADVDVNAAARHAEALLGMKVDEARIRGARLDGYIAKPMAYLRFLAAVTAHLGRP